MSDDDPIHAADAALAAGDVGGAMRHLRLAARDTPVVELAPLVRLAAQAMNFDDLVLAAEAVVERPASVQTLYDFGYACVEHGAAYLAVPALTAALAEAPGSSPIITELVTAYEDETRYTDAVELLEANEANLRPWPDRYLLVINSVLAGDLTRAERHFGRLDPPTEESWGGAYERVELMLRRAAALGARPGPDDLRGWHYVLNGGILGTLSPYGFASGMAGRWAYVQDSPERCLLGLERLRLVLAATRRRPAAVLLLPDRSSRILGLAAAGLLDLPAVPYGQRGDGLVVAYDLTEQDSETLQGLRGRPPGQLLAEHATCWTDPPLVAADYTGLLHQVDVPPWAERTTADGSRTPADDRPAEEIAGEILAERVSPDDGDGETPPDPDSTLEAFASRVRPEWPMVGAQRDRLWSPGPVRSSRFW